MSIGTTGISLLKLLSLPLLQNSLKSHDNYTSHNSHILYIRVEQVIISHSLFSMVMGTQQKGTSGEEMVSLQTLAWEWRVEGGR